MIERITEKCQISYPQMYRTLSQYNTYILSHPDLLFKNSLNLKMKIQTLNDGTSDGVKVKSREKCNPEEKRGNTQI